MRTLGLVCMLVAVAHAEPGRPWADGVPAAVQDQVTAELARGNELLDQGLFVQAVDVYRAALRQWDHPAIRYNLAVALINLDREIDAFGELERALRFGPAALQPEVYQQALTYQKLIAGHIVQLHIECVDPGTHIVLDGADLAVPCPGELRQLIRPGRHVLVASKPGSLTRSIDLALSGGDAPTEHIDLMTLDEATVTHHRWARWKPWAVVAAGGAIAIAGLAVDLQAAATFRSYDKAIATLCPDHPCTSLPAVVSDAYAEGRTETHVGAGLLIGGGVVVAAGAVLLYLDRGIQERIGYTVGPHGAGVSARWSF